MGVPGLKPRPALVVTVFADHAPEYIVKLIYGTSQKINRLYKGEFLIDINDHSAYRLAGLSYPTKFNCKNALDLPYNSDWFKVPPMAPYGQVPKLGLLHPNILNRFLSAWSAVARKKPDS